MLRVTSEQIGAGRDEFMTIEREIRTPSRSVRAIASTFMSLYDIAFLESEKQCARCHISMQLAIDNSIDRAKLNRVFESEKNNLTQEDRSVIRELCQAFNESVESQGILELFEKPITLLYRILQRYNM
jgi:hypothetical protein